MAQNFLIKYVDEKTVLPERELHSAVFLMALRGTQILAIRNDRGWEVPGGHIEDGETKEEALVREVQEEAGASFSAPRLIALIESDDQGKYKDKVMFVYATSNFELEEFVASEDAFEREIIGVDEFLRRHEGVIDFTALIARAQYVLAHD